MVPFFENKTESEICLGNLKRSMEKKDAKKKSILISPKQPSSTLTFCFQGVRLRVKLVKNSLKKIKPSERPAARSIWPQHWPLTAASGDRFLRDLI